MLKIKRKCGCFLLESQKYDKTINRYFTSTIGSKMSNLQQIIEAAFEKRAEITPKTVDAQTRAAIEEVIEGLDSGKYRVAEKLMVNGLLTNG